MKDFNPNFYKILGVPDYTDAKQVKVAYRELAKKFHPDKHLSDKKEFEELLKKINDAYDTLKDNNKKEYYDNLLRNYHQVKAEKFEQAKRANQQKYKQRTYYNWGHVALISLAIIGIVALTVSLTEEEA